MLKKNLKSQNHIKHIDIIYQHIRGFIEDRKLAIEQILSLNILTNGLTKVLIIGYFKKH